MDNSSNSSNSSGRPNEPGGYGVPRFVYTVRFFRSFRSLHEYSIRRVMLLASAAVCLCALLTVALDTLIAPRLILSYELSALARRAVACAQAVSDAKEAGLDLAAVPDVALLFADGAADAYADTALLLDAQGRVLLPAGRAGEEMLTADALRQLDANLYWTQMPRQPAATVPLPLVKREGGGDAQTETLAIAVRAGASGMVVYLAHAVPQIGASLYALKHAAIAAAMLTLLIIAPLCIRSGLRMGHALMHVRDRALRMAAGDLSTRADAAATGEVGEVARALNTLGERLSQTLQALLVERNRVVSVLNALDEAILAVNAHGEVNLVNPPLRTLFSVSPGDGADALPPEAAHAYLAALETNEPQTFSLTVGTGDAARILDCRVLPVGGDGKSHGAVGVFRDATQEHRLEQTRRDYVANVSHELRAPLTAMRCLIEPLSDGLIADESARQDTYRLLLRETERMARLVEDTLELSRLQSGASPIEKETFDPLPLLRHIGDTFEGNARAAGVALETLLPDSLPDVGANADRMEQILVALLDNAIKFTPQGGTVTLSAERVIAEGKIHIAVTDTGPGIKPKDLPHVFERFYKADASRTGQGTGLGLAIAHELAERMGERLWAENRAGGGARFVLTVATV